MDKNVPVEHAIRIKGQTNPSSLHKYMTLSKNRKKEMSHFFGQTQLMNQIQILRAYFTPCFMAKENMVAGSI